MLKLLIAAGGLLMVSSVYAEIPLLNFSCPNNIDVHADQGGPVYINGNQAKLKISNNNYYEAGDSGVTVSISINPDGSATVAYTDKRGTSGVCQSLEYAGFSSSESRPPSSAIRACNAVEDRFGEMVSYTSLKPGAWEIILEYNDGQYVCNVERDSRITYFEKLRR